MKKILKGDKYMRNVLHINAKSKAEAIAALETSLEMVKKMTDEGPVKRKLQVVNEGYVPRRSMS